MREIKDFTNAIAGLEAMDLAALHELYSQMLATAHDLGYKVPNDELVETEDATVLRTVIPPLHTGILKFNAGLDTPREESPTTTARAARSPKPALAVVPKAKKPAKVKPAPATVATTPAPKGATQETTMKNATAAKTAAAPAKKAAKKTAAKKAPAAKKAAAKNARTPAGPRTKYSDKAVIKVLHKDGIPSREGTGQHDRLKTLFKFDGKPVADYLKKDGLTITLKWAVEKEWVKIVG